RPILPAGPAPPANTVVGAPVSRQVPPKNVHVKAACETCRKRKVKCSGERPKCNSCVRSDQNCQYISSPTETYTQARKRKLDELQEKSSVYEELVGLLRSVPEQEAHDILRRLRAGGDVAAVTRQVKDGCLLLQLALSPETRLRYTFPYVAEMPARLQVHGNIYLDSPIYGAALSSTPSPSSPDSGDLEARYQCIYLKPYHTAKIIDPRLSQIKASRWTTVISDSDLFSKLLHAYLLHEYPTYPTFHKDYFLDDLAKGKTKYCSSVMVNTILASACHCYTDILNREQFWNPQGLGYKFLAEARRLWELECRTGRVTLTLAQTAVLLNLEYNHNGQDDVGYVFLQQAVGMANTLGLYKPDPHGSTQSKRMKNAREFFAWGLFSWTVLQSYYFYREPLIKTPPATPLPDPEKDPSWYGEFWLQYPMNSSLFPARHGYTVRTIALLRIILCEIACRAFRGEGGTQTLSWNDIVEFRAKLDRWYQAIPEPISAKNVVFPWHLKTHLEYYAALYNLHTGLLSPQGSTSARQKTVSEVSSFSITRFETITRLYYLRHSFETMDGFLTFHLSHLAAATLKAMQSLSHSTSNGLPPDQRLLKTLRSTVFLCIKGLNDQARYIHVAVVVYRLNRDTLSNYDLGLLRTNVNLFESTEADASLAQNCHSAWPLPMKTDEPEGPQGAAVGNLVRQYGRLAIEEGSEEGSRDSTPEGRD
ncbi:hypothetical protein B0T25DRAFT_599547, partial [Lasiosphaeria hispida]